MTAARSADGVITVGSSGWDSYWEALNAESWLYREQAELYVQELSRAIPLRSDMRVLDFGCGFGFVSQLLAGRVAEVALWDASGHMRREALARVAGHANCHLLDLSNPTQLSADISFDLILVNSVVQYMSLAQFFGWLGAWRRLLAVRGGLIISDLIPPGQGMVADLVDLLRFSRRHGVLLRALRQIAGGFLTYGRKRHSNPLSHFSLDELKRLGREAGFRVRLLPQNLTHFTRRKTACFEPEGEAFNCGTAS